MPVTISGTSGLAGVNGSASTPAVQGEDTNTGVFFPAADAVAVATGGSERMRVDSSGNVGIGASPTGFGRFEVTQATNKRIFTSTDAAYGGNAFVGINDAGAEVAFGIAGSQLVFATGATERARINSSGNLLVGTTSPLSGSSSTFSTGASGGFSFGLAVAHTSTNAADVRGFLVQSPNYNGDAGYLIIGGRSGGDRFYVLTSGNVLNSNNSYGAISDVKVKENITDATPKLDKLNQVRVVNYNLLGEEHKQLGVIAQELEQIFPGMVEETADKDAEGNVIGTTTKSVKYSVFVPMLIKAVQELTARIAALEAAQ